MRTRTFLLLFFSAYAVLAALGIFLFHSPMLSSGYLTLHGVEHDRYVRITKNEAYQRYRERPHLHPLEGGLAQDAAFAAAYEARPEFRAERLRRMLYVVYFRVLNAAAFLALVLYFGWRPLLRFLDSRIEAAQRHLAQSATARAAAEAKRAETQTRLEQWPEISRKLETDTESVIEKELVRIREQARNIRERSAKEAADKKRAELLAASATLKRELVGNAMDVLKDRYAREASLEGLKQDVAMFTQLMDFLA